MQAVPMAPEPKDGDGSATFRFGTRVTGVEDVDGKVHVKFEDVNTGATQILTAGLAIVADGSNSSIRKALLPDVKREYLGYMCWRGTAREDQINEKWNKRHAEKMTLHLMSKTYLLKYASFVP